MWQLLLFCLHITTFVHAMLPEIDHTEWVEIMSNKDGVVIESDPESMGKLSQIEQSYFSLKPEDRPPTDNSPRVHKKISGVDDLSTLIIESYPAGMDAIIAKLSIIYKVNVKKSGKLKTSWF